MEFPPASFTQSQTAQHHYTVLTAAHQSLVDAMGLPPETRLVDIGFCSATTIRGGRRWVRVRCESAEAGKAAQVPIQRGRVALALVPPRATSSEDEHQQPDHYQQTNQEDDANRAAEKLEHEGRSLSWVHLLRLGYRRIVPSPVAKADG